MASKDKFEELNLSHDEVKRLGEALKDEQFRKLFVEYAQEISDPENKRKYEEEIAQLENERGMDVSFVNPEPGYVMKSSANGDTKIFINICKNEKIGKPVATRKEGPNGRSGVQWSIPHSFAPPRDDLDKSGEKCRVYDVVFHPDTYRMAETNERFKKLVDDTALDGLETQYGCKVDRKNIKTLKLKYKGVPTATVIRTKLSDSEKKIETKSDEHGLMDGFPYPYTDNTSNELAQQKADEIKKIEVSKRKEDKSKLKRTESNGDNPTEPKYTITHRSELDLQEYRNAPDSKPSTRPKELVIAVDLPLLNSAASVGLDIFERRLLLESVKPASYKLDLKLPFPVDESCGSAKFDKAKHRLTVTLPVIPDNVPDMPNYIVDADQDHVDSSLTSTLLTSDEGNTQTSPLVQVLSSSTNKTSISQSQVSSTSQSHVSQNNALNKCSSEETDNKNIWIEETSFNTNAKVTYHFPDFIQRQDNETVSFVLDVKRVGFDTVTKLFPSPNSLHVRCTSMGSGCFPMHYSFYMRFPSECEIAPDHCSVDLAEQNLVILILKSRDSRGLWQKFWVGEDENHLTEALFPTEANLELELCQLEREAIANEKMVQCQNQNENEAPEVKVTEMSEKSLKINLNLMKKACNEPDEEYDDNLPTPEILVTSDGRGRSLHGILKQRSRSHSESSEDLTSTGSYSRENSTSSSSNFSESPISESEEADGLCFGHVKKSVSFSDHVDRATYKPGTTVCCMTQALKSKRKRNRKREEKKRRRNNSTGSEYSSSDEYPQQEDNVDEDFHVQDTTTDTTMDTKTTNAAPVSTKTKQKNKSKKSGKQKGKQVIDTSAKCKADDEAISLDETFRTSKSYQLEKSGDMKAADSECASESTGEVCVSSVHCKEKDGSTEASEDVVKVINDQAPLDNIQIDSDDDQDVREKSELTDVKPAKPPRTKSGQKSASKELTKSCDTYRSEIGVEKPGPDLSGAPPATAAGDSNDTETVLSWSEQKGKSSEHATKCAFNFSNSVMFDLDVD